MNTGAISSYFDVAQVTLYVFWFFFAGLIIYLRKEDQREGYPLVFDRVTAQSPDDFPSMPSPKEFRMVNGEVRYAPRPEPRETIAAVQGSYPGSPYEPTGNPMIDGIGPAAWANRSDEPDCAFDDQLPKIVPLRAAADFYLATEDVDPRGFTVVGADGVEAGTIVDAWVDRSEVILRYLEIERSGAGGSGRVLLPIGFVDTRAKTRQVRVSAILGSQFADVPVLRRPDCVSLREEDRIAGYYAGGTLYATPERMEPFL
jgi:photosynthetic reaction center H subunit